MVLDSGFAILCCLLGFLSSGVGAAEHRGYVKSGIPSGVSPAPPSQLQIYKRRCHQCLHYNSPGPAGSTGVGETVRPPRQSPTGGADSQVGSAHAEGAGRRGPQGRGSFLVGDWYPGRQPHRRQGCELHGPSGTARGDLGRWCLT